MTTFAPTATKTNQPLQLFTVSFSFFLVVVGCCFGFLFNLF
jgi:hypothetical protein